VVIVGDSKPRGVSSWVVEKEVDLLCPGLLAVIDEPATEELPV
jgi:hypothetical protein